MGKLWGRQKENYSLGLMKFFASAYHAMDSNAINFFQFLEVFFQ